MGYKGIGTSLGWTSLGWKARRSMFQRSAELKINGVVQSVTIGFVTQFETLCELCRLFFAAFAVQGLLFSLPQRSKDFDRKGREEKAAKVAKKVSRLVVSMREEHPLG